MIHLAWLFDVFVIATAIAHALLEIQIEGAHGWAEKLPTRHFRSRVISRFSEHKYITGFHVWTIVFVTLIAHFPILFVEQWSWNYEAIVVGFVILHFTFEDFFWFVFNPHFGLLKFKPKYVWWHTKWFLGLPISYWFSFPIGVLILTIGTSGV